MKPHPTTIYAGHTLENWPISESNFPREFTDSAIQSFGDFRQRFEGDFLFGPLNVANIIPRQVGFFGQIFLAQVKLFPFGTDFCSQSAINFARIGIHNRP